MTIAQYTYRKPLHPHTNGKNKPRLTQEIVKQLFTYDFRTGILTRKGKEHKCPIYADKVWIDFTDGKKRQYSVAKIIWCYMKGEWEDYVMRIDGDSLNNKWSNFKVRGFNLITIV